MEAKTKKKRKLKLNLFHVLMFLSACLGVYILIHDFIVWAIIPLFTGKVVILTYFGMFVDLSAMAIIELTIQCIKES